MQSQAARAHLEPAQPVPTVVAREDGESLSEREQLLMQLLELDRGVAELGNGHLHVVQRMRKRVERIAHIRNDLTQLVTTFLARRVGSQNTDGRLQFVDPSVQLGLRIRQRRGAQLLEHAFEFARAQCDAEELHGKVRNLVRLVDDDGLGSRQEFNEALLLHREVGQQQVMIDDDEVGLLGRLARLDNVAPRILRTMLPETIVGPPFQQRRHHGSSDCLRNQRQVAMVQLVLQRLRARADNRLAARQKRGNQVRKGLARTRARLDHQALRSRDRLGDGLGHPGLTGARLEAAQVRLERARCAKIIGQFAHGAKVTRLACKSRASFCWQ